MGKYSIAIVTDEVSWSKPYVEELAIKFRKMGHDVVCRYSFDRKNSYLRTIPHMKKLFHCRVGLSEHTLGIGAAVASIALGATVIERHFTLSRADGGVDAAFSLEPEEMAQLVRECRAAYESLGEIRYAVQEQEKKSLVFRRSLYVVQDMKKGDAFTEKNLRRIRPGFGLPPKYYDIILGKKIKKDIPRGTALRWDLVE